MVQKISLSDIVGESGHTEFKTLLASDSEAGKRLFHVLILDEDYTSQVFRVEVKYKNQLLSENFDGIFPAIRAYNKIQ